MNNVEIFKWLKSQNYQTEQGEQEYRMYFDVDMPKILEAYYNWRVKDQWISPEQILNFIQQDFYHVVPGMTISDTDENHTYKDRIILTDAGFYWDSDTEGEQPMTSEDIVEMYKKSLSSPKDTEQLKEK